MRAWKVITTIFAALALTAPAAFATSSGRVELSGRFVVVHADGERLSGVRYYLAAGRAHYPLRLQGRSAPAPGSAVHIRGTLRDGAVEVADVDVSASAHRAGVKAVGTRTLLAILVRWGPGSPSTTQSVARTFLFGSDERSSDAWFRVASHGSLGWQGDVTPTLAIQDPGGCDLYRIATDARAAALVAGYDVDAYDHVMVNVPNWSCGAAGYGEVGGRYTWIHNGLANLADGWQRYVANHELGHNLGRWHSHGLECGRDTVSPACLDSHNSNDEYGNVYDVMGNNAAGTPNGAVAMFSAKPLIELGWFAGRWQAVTEGGTFALAPLEAPTTVHPQALVIETSRHRYYVEYRQPIGVDAFLASIPAASAGVQVSMRDDLPFGDNGPLLLDLEPDSASGSQDWFDASLDPGQTFTEVGGAFRMRVDSAATTAAKVTVEFGDFAAPETRITAGPEGWTRDANPGFAFVSSEEASTFECRLDGTAWESCSSPKTYSSLPEGDHAFRVRAVDAAGHVDETAAERAFAVDVTAPRVAVTSPAADAVVAGSVLLGASATDANGIGRVKWFLDGIEVATDSVGPVWDRLWRTTTVSDGRVRLIAKARDHAGNWGSSRSVWFTIANSG